MKTLSINICLLLHGILLYGQNGLERLIVEKYYVSDANDSIVSEANGGGSLPVASVTWRFYADLLPGYKLQAVYGVDAAPAGVLSPGDHELRIETTTSFFNNEDRGDKTPSYTKARTADNSVMLDSWVSVGGACAGFLGLEKSADNGANTTTNADGMLQNADSSAGIPLTSQDGLLSGTVEPVTLVGFATELDILEAVSQAGNMVTTYNASWASLNGSAGPTADNKVLIAQITTDGVLNYAFNIQVGTPAGDVQNFVAASPVADEIYESTLTGVLSNSDICGVLNCNDSIACTQDSCINGLCIYTPVNCNLNISGAIVSEQGAAIPAVIVSLSGSDVQSLITPDNGIYDFDISPGGNYAITPSKSNDSITANGVTTFDILMMQRHILQIQPLETSYKIIAGDVNLSGGVTTLDIVLTRAVILGNTPTFPSGTLWQFINGDYFIPDSLNPFPFEKTRTYNNLSQSHSNQNFIGMKLGDVNNSWDSNTPKMSAVGEVQFMMDQYEADTGDEIVVPVMVKDFEDIAAYQFTLSWDEKVLSLREVNNKSLNGYYGRNYTDQGFLTTSWNDEKAQSLTLPDGTIAFELNFRLVGETGCESKIKIASVITSIEAINSRLQGLNVISVNGAVKVTDSNLTHNANNCMDLTIHPNPFAISTKITFTSKNDEVADVVILDINGIEVNSFSTGTAAHIKWDGRNSRGKMVNPGLYFIRALSDRCSSLAKVILSTQD